MIWKFGVLFLVSLLILLWEYRKGRNQHHVPRLGEPLVFSKILLILVALMALCYIALAVLLSFSWIQGDEWLFLYGGSNFQGRLWVAWNHYMRGVSRLGEFLLILLSFSESQWQRWLITPLFAAMAPLALHSLVKRRGDTIISSKGCWFYVGTFFLCLLGVYLPWWRNYWCVAASFNYLYPTVLTLYFLSWFRTDRQGYFGWLRCVCLFGLGVVCGWGTECMTATVLPILTVWVLYNLFSQKSLLPTCSYWGYVGFLWGAMALFGSPALAYRALHESTSNAARIGEMTAEQLQTFLQNLDWGAVNSLVGGGGIIALCEIPLLEHYYFLPFIGARFLECCVAPACLWAVLMLVFACSRKGEKRLDLLVGTLFAGVSGLCALSYLVQCIPTRMSFLPACFLLIAGCCYLWLRLPSLRGIKVVSLLLVAAGGYVFIPAGIQAGSLKKYDTMRREEIVRQKAAGEQDVILPPLDLGSTSASLGLVAPNDIKENPKSYPNDQIARYYGVRSVSQKK